MPGTGFLGRPWSRTQALLLAYIALIMAVAAVAFAVIGNWLALAYAAVAVVAAGLGWLAWRSHEKHKPTA